MRIIGVIGAMDEEIERLRSELEVISVKSIAETDFTYGRMNGRTVALARSGIGKVNAAVCAQILIDHFAVDCVINTGVAGACSPEIRTGDVIISTELVQHDFNTGAFGDLPGYIPRLNRRFFQADEELTALALEAAQALGGRVFAGRIASGDQFISDKGTKNRIWSVFKPLCVEMEGAAIAHACCLNRMPFAAIRCVSDESDDSTGASFETFVKNSSETAALIVSRMIERL